MDFFFGCGKRRRMMQNQRIEEEKLSFTAIVGEEERCKIREKKAELQKKEEEENEGRKAKDNLSFKL